MTETSRYNYKAERFHPFIKKHNLVNRIYNMLYYYKFFKGGLNKTDYKNEIKNNLEDISYIEELAKYFEMKLKNVRKNVDLKLNLQELVCDLNYLKQYF